MLRDTKSAKHKSDDCYLDTAPVCIWTHIHMYLAYRYVVSNAAMMSPGFSGCVTQDRNVQEGAVIHRTM